MTRFFSLVVLAMCVLLSQGTVRVLNFKKSGQDVTAAWQRAAAGLAERDTVKVNFGAGTYYLSGTVEMLCNLTMSGKGSAKTTLKCRVNSRFTDDCFIKAAGHLGRTIAVEVANMGIDLEKHKGMAWNVNSAKYLLKIYHADRVCIKSVSSYIDNAVCTNLNMRCCSNVAVTGCSLTNYNNNHDGGILWLSGNTENVLVSNNEFRKQGNDEVVGFYGTGNDAWSAGTNAKSAYKRNIKVCNNKLWLSGAAGQPLTMAFSMFNVEGQKSSNVAADVRDVTFSGNEITVAGDVRCIFAFQREQNTTGKNIRYANNTVRCLAESSVKGSARAIFRIVDHSEAKEPFVISGNVIDNKANVLGADGYNYYNLLDIDGATVEFDGNNVSSTKDAANKQSGIVGMYVNNAGGKVNMKNNVLKGLCVLASLSVTKGSIQGMEINASGNRFEGGTTIFCNNLDRLDLNLSNNEFFSTNWEYFLQEFAKTGTLVFRNNVVTANKGGGSLLSHYSNVPTKNMHFERLEVCNNKFYGIQSTELLKNMTNVKHRVVSGNTF